MSNKSKLYSSLRAETFFSKTEIKEKITDDYIRGLIEGEGCFGVDRDIKGQERPAFLLKMHFRDMELIEGVRDYLGIKNRVYEYTHQDRHTATLIIREIDTLKNKIIPLCKDKLLGYKGSQLNHWLRHFPYLNSLHLQKP